MTIGTAAAPSRPDRARRRRRPATPTQIISIATIATVAAVVAIAAADGAPTGTPVLDAAWRALLVVATTVAGARARRWSLAIGAGIVTVAAAGYWSVAGLAALGLTFVLAWDDRRSRIAGAGAGALVSLAALQLGWPTTTFATAVVAALALVPILVSAYRTSSRNVRRRVRIGAAAFGAAVFVAMVGAAMFVVTQRSNLERAVDEALDAAEGLGGSSTEQATAGFASARERLDDVVAAADAPWTWPARALPIVGANLHSVRESAGAGADLAGAAERLSGEVDYERLRLDGGGVDLTVLAGFREPVADAERSLARSAAALRDARSPFVVGPLAERITTLADRVERAHDGAVTARLGVETAPDLLGASGPRRYLLLLGNPAEARDLGGHLGNWAEIVADGGRLDVVRVGQPYDLFGPAGPEHPLLPAPEEYPRSLVEMNPTRFPQNWGATPDLPTVARLAAELYPQTAGGGPVDGVIYADPHALAASLQVTGPVRVPGTDRSLDADTAVEFLERGQYAELGSESQGDEVVTDLVRAALDALLEGRLPAPSTAATAFGPAVDGGHLRFVSLHDGDLPFLERLHLDGAVEVPAGGDALAVISRNANPSKIDAYLERRIDDRVTWDPETGEVRAAVVVTLTNTAPASGLPDVVAGPPPGAPPGTNRTELAVLSPFRLTGAAIDGVPAAAGTRDDVGELRRHSLSLDLAPGQTRTVTFELEGTVEGPDYRFRWIGQPLSNPDEVRLVIESTGTPFRGGPQAGSVDLADSLVGGGRLVTLRTET